MRKVESIELCVPQYQSLPLVNSATMLWILSNLNRIAISVDFPLYLNDTLPSFLVALNFHVRYIYISAIEA